MACESQFPKLSEKPLGWVCTGSADDLVEVMRVKLPDGDVPVVAPKDSVSICPAAGIRLEDIRPFDGSRDHYHLVILE